MSIHRSLDFETDLDDGELSEEVFQRYLDETNAKKNALNFEYLVSKEDGYIYVDEIGGDDDGVNARRALITDGEIVEGVLTDEEAEEAKSKYEDVKD